MSYVVDDIWTGSVNRVGGSITTLEFINVSNNGAAVTFTLAVR